jgi:hypothetical protein
MPTNAKNSSCGDEGINRQIEEAVESLLWPERINLM